MTSPPTSDTQKPNHRAISPPVMYFGTPVALITTMSPDGTDNIGPMSSVWALAETLVLGWETKAQTLSNLEEQRECVINLPDRSLVEHVEALAPLSGRNPPPEHNKGRFTYEPDKFAASGLTRQPSETVTPPRIAECPIQIEATVSAIHQPAGPDGDDFRIVETHAKRIWANERLVKDERDHIDTDLWQPLLYVFRHYFGTGDELGRTFRSED